MNTKWKNFFFDVLAYVFVAGFFALLAYLLCGCSTKYVAVPEYHYESHHSVDTIIQRDSVMKENNTIIREADSTMLLELGIRLKDGERAILVLRREVERLLSQQRETVHDTVVKVDSIRVPYPIEKQLTRWESLKMEAGGYLLVLLIVLVVVFVVVMITKRGIIFRRPRDGLRRSANILSV